MVNKNYPSELSNWAKEAYDWIVSEGISDGHQPKKLVTREEVWEMLYRYHKKYGK